jgi:N-acetylmuramoyl-L-alanine amidase
MPGALLELGSLSNLESEQILHREGFQRGMAESLARAIGNWVYGEQGRSRRDTQVP